MTVAKRAAARAAAAELPAEGVVGLGTGSTAAFFVEEVAARVRAGARLVGVATSRATREIAELRGIPLLGDDGPWDILVTADGADEVDPQGNVIKGGGAAHTREKIVNAASRRNVIMVDAAKLSPRLGTRGSVPVEVLSFGHAATARALDAFGCATVRSGVRTDGGNVVYDVKTGPIANPAALDNALRSIPGVVETGLFIGRATLVLIGHEDGSVTRLVP